MAIRIPRVLATALVGAAWAAAGVAMQGLYRTPLADPALVGIGAGAALGRGAGAGAGRRAWASSPGSAGHCWWRPGPSSPPSLAAAVVHRVASASGRVVVATMLLAGLRAERLPGGPHGARRGSRRRPGDGQRGLLDAGLVRRGGRH